MPPDLKSPLTKKVRKGGNQENVEDKNENMRKHSDLPEDSGRWLRRHRNRLREDPSPAADGFIFISSANFIAAARSLLEQELFPVMVTKQHRKKERI